jgi:hypothetical protein
MSEPNFNIDPLFDSTYIGAECDVCEREFDQYVYRSDTCAKCEDRLTEKISTLRREGRL